MVCESLHLGLCEFSAGEDEDDGQREEYDENEDDRTANEIWKQFVQDIFDSRVDQMLL